MPRYRLLVPHPEALQGDGPPAAPAPATSRTQTAGVCAQALRYLLAGAGVALLALVCAAAAGRLGQWFYASLTLGFGWSALLLIIGFSRDEFEIEYRLQRASAALKKLKKAERAYRVRLHKVATAWQAAYEEQGRNASAAYNTLYQEHQHALRTIAALRAELKERGAQRGAQWVAAESNIQQAARAIANAWLLGTPYSRDAICADGKVRKESWSAVMQAFARHGLAQQNSPGGPWRITASDANALLAAVDLPPAVATPLPATTAGA